MSSTVKAARSRLSRFNAKIDRGHRYPVVRSGSCEVKS